MPAREIIPLARQPLLLAAPARSGKDVQTTHVKLIGRDKTRVELRIEGYQFPGSASAGRRDWDANWLVISGRVELPNGREHAFTDPCLTTWEARELAGWLRSVVAGDMQPSPSTAPLNLAFTEPCLAFNLDQADTDVVALRIYLSLEAEPPFTVEGRPGVFENYVRLLLSPEDLATAAREWDWETTAFPVR